MTDTPLPDEQLDLIPIDYSTFSTGLLQMMLDKHVLRIQTIGDTTDQQSLVDKAFSMQQAVKLATAIKQRLTNELLTD